MRLRDDDRVGASENRQDKEPIVSILDFREQNKICPMAVQRGAAVPKPAGNERKIDVRILFLQNFTGMGNRFSRVAEDADADLAFPESCAACCIDGTFIKPGDALRLPVKNLSLRGEADPKRRPLKDGKSDLRFQCRHLARKRRG